MGLEIPPETDRSTRRLSVRGISMRTASLWHAIEVSLVLATMSYYVGIKPQESSKLFKHLYASMQQ